MLVTVPSDDECLLSIKKKEKKKKEHFPLHNQSFCLQVKCGNQIFKTMLSSLENQAQKHQRLSRTCTIKKPTKIITKKTFKHHLNSRLVSISLNGHFAVNTCTLHKKPP